MSKRVDAVYLLGMLTYARRIQERLGGATREAFENDLNLRESIVLNLVFIGEAVNKLSLSARSAHPEIAWTEISDMRNRLVHGYFDIDIEKVWTAATEDVPALIAALEEILPVK
jgi:uncharacterized protein with HEPN domain